MTLAPTRKEPLIKTGDPFIRSKAYLIVTLDTRPQFPQVVGVAIYSSPISGLTLVHSHESHAEVYRVEADSYGEAKDIILKHVQEVPMWKWMWPWLDESLEAHTRRYKLHETARVSAEQAAFWQPRHPAFAPELPDYHDPTKQPLRAPVTGGTCDSSVNASDGPSPYDLSDPRHPAHRR